MRRAQKTSLCLADLVAISFDAASDLGVDSPSETAEAITRLLLRTNNARALESLLKGSASLSSSPKKLH
jgi:hypothetical protein